VANDSFGHPQETAHGEGTEFDRGVSVFRAGSDVVGRRSMTGAGRIRRNRRHLHHKADRPVEVGQRIGFPNRFEEFAAA
jgi:hypothetical protein